MHTAMHSAFMHSQHIANFQMIRMQSTLHRRLLCGWRNTVMILYTKVITSTCNAMAHLCKELHQYHPPQKQDIKIKTVLFICWKHLQNCSPCGRMPLYVNGYRKCSCSSAIQ